MKIIKSKILSRFPEIVFGFSTKVGLNKKAPFHFNMSKSVTDDEKSVVENRTAFFAELGLADTKICFQKQIHSSIVTKVDSNYEMIESDALYTSEKNTTLVISSADCVPVFLYDPVTKIVAGVHSGWRGTEQKILEKTINKLEAEGVNSRNLISYIGPCISGENYEIGEEVANQFDSKYIRESENKLLLDLKSVNYDMLISAGIPSKNIEVSDLCSFEETNLLHSYRREGKISGRAVGVICIRGEKIVT
ncbi:MAG: peptidoglycan editing factor PgeF [Rhodothermaceae bacterium]